MLNHRELELLSFFVKNQKFSYEEIQKKYKISERAVRYNIENINYFLEVLKIKQIQKKDGFLYFDNTQDISSIYSLLREIEIFSQVERLGILKFIICFDSSGLNLTKISEKLGVSRTTIKKDMKILKKELIQEELNIVYKNNNGYKLKGEAYKIELFKINELKRNLNPIIKNEKDSAFKKVMIELFESLLFLKDTNNIKKFILNIQNDLNISVSDEIFDVLYAYLIILVTNERDIEELEFETTNKGFLEDTKEFICVEKELGKILELENRKLSKEIILKLTDFILGITTNNFNVYYLENWIHEEIFIKKMINEFNKYVDIDISNDKVLIDCLIYHMKPAIYRIKNNVKVSNPVFKELIINKDPVLELVKIVISDIEKMFGISFPEEELALLAFHFKASVDRNTYQNLKRILLVCGLGYGSSRLLEQSIKENYNVDIVDVLPYYLLGDVLKNYKNIDLILTTLDIEEKFEIPVVKINPLLKQEDFIEMSKYNIPKNDNKIFLSKIIEIIDKNSDIISKKKLINDIKKEFKNKIIDDINYKDIHIKDFINNQNVSLIDKVKDWEEAVRISGNLLKLGKCVDDGYIDEMIELVKKYGSYIVIDDGIALPHAGISKNVLNTGIGVLVVKEAVFFPDGKSANIFISFSSRDNTSHLNILNDLFNFITKCDLKNKLLKAKNKEEIKNYFTKMNF